MHDIEVKLDDYFSNANIYRFKIIVSSKEGSENFEKELKASNQTIIYSNISIVAVSRNSELTIKLWADGSNCEALIKKISNLTFNISVVNSNQT